MKYIIFEVEGLSTPIVFPDYVDHNKVLMGTSKAVSAGFCSVWGKDVSCSGESFTLGLKSQPGDEKIIGRLFS